MVNNVPRYDPEKLQYHSGFPEKPKLAHCVEPLENVVCLEPEDTTNNPSRIEGKCDTPRDETHDTERTALISLSAQGIYWTASVIAVAFCHAVHRFVPLAELMAPILLAFVTLQIVAAKLLHRTRHSHLLSLPQIIRGFIGVIVFVELAWFIPRVNRDTIPALWEMWTKAAPAPMVPHYQMIAIQLCTAYWMTYLLDGDCFGYGTHIVLPDEVGASSWCQPPWFIVFASKRSLWKRGNRLRLVCHHLLAMAICNALARAVAYFLAIKVNHPFMFLLWGAGCLGNFQYDLQMTILLLPIYHLTWWLCNEILVNFGL